MTFYASVITLATIADVAGGIYVIYQLFHGEGAADEAKCEKDQAAINADFTHFACNASFKTLRTIVIVLWVAFWIFTICACPSLSRARACVFVGARVLTMRV